ncbi:MAG: hypothetical protein WCF65_07900 [Parachlamydiaceae bacterium]
MLKLERKSRDGQVNLLMCTRERLFTRSLIIAFALALGLHSLFIILFHVSPFKIRVIETLFPPIGVEAYPSINVDGSAVVAEVTTRPLSIQGIPIPERSQPVAAVHPLYSMTRPRVYGPGKDSADYPFSRMEKEAYFPDLVVTRKKNRVPVAIVVSGELAGRGVIADVADGSLQTVAVSSELRVIYDVRVDGRSGKVFWFEPIQRANVPSIDRAAESMLRRMAFTKGTDTQVTDGTIEFHFNRAVSS